MKHVTVFSAPSLSLSLRCSPSLLQLEEVHTGPEWNPGRVSWRRRDNCFVEPGLEGGCVDQKTGRVIRGNVKRYVRLIDTNWPAKKGRERGALIKFGLEPREKATTARERERERAKKVFAAAAAMALALGGDVCTRAGFATQNNKQVRGDVKCFKSRKGSLSGCTSSRNLEIFFTLQRVTIRSPRCLSYFFCSWDQIDEER